MIRVAGAVAALIAAGMSLCAQAGRLATDAATAARPTLFIIGDSTVRNGTKGQQGWGDLLAAHFDSARINVVNRAIGGRSSRTFQTEGRWDRVLAEVKAGDFVLMQFGHNDSGKPDDPARPRGSLRGVGDETREIDHPATGKKEMVRTYGLVSAQIIADTNDCGKWAAESAKAGGAPFVDLNEIIAKQYEALGREKVGTLFGGDHTHTNAAGAQINADAVIEGLRALNGSPLGRLLTSK